jgi:hypothetical protein
MDRHLEPATDVDDPADPGHQPSRIGYPERRPVRPHELVLHVDHEQSCPLAVEREEGIALVCLPGKLEHFLLAEAAGARVHPGSHDLRSMLPAQGGGRTSGGSSPPEGLPMVPRPTPGRQYVRSPGSDQSTTASTSIRYSG